MWLADVQMSALGTWMGPTSGKRVVQATVATPERYGMAAAWGHDRLRALKTHVIAMFLPKPVRGNIAIAHGVEPGDHTRMRDNYDRQCDGETCSL